MNTNHTPVKRSRRLVYALIGLAAGDAALLLIVLLNALRLFALLKATHMGEPLRAVAEALQQGSFYAICSFVGWLIIGVPVALVFPASSIARLTWPRRLLAGATLGPVALLVIFMILGHGNVEFPASFKGTGLLWMYSIVVSTVSFVVYSALLRERPRG